MTFFFAIVLLIRYRREWEPAIEAIEDTIDIDLPFVGEEGHEHHHDGAADSKAGGDDDTIHRTLPQVIFPHEYSDNSDDKKPAVNPQAASPQEHQFDELPTTASSDDKFNGETSNTTEGGDGETQAQMDLGAFWARWSQAIYDARPNVTRITLRSHASSQKPPDQNAARQPYRDLVRNTAEEIEYLRTSHAQFVQELETEFGLQNDTSDKQSEDGKIVLGEPKHTRQWSGVDGLFKGKGIVMVGGGEYWGPAVVGLHMLRKSGSSLPVEVFVPDDDEYEKGVCEDYLPKLNAKCVVLSHILAKSYITTGNKEGAQLKTTHYQLKAMALLVSSFSEVLMLDSDSIPLVDPLLHIFDTEPYKTEGMILWPDLWASTESPKFWKIAGREDFPKDLASTSSEAGQIVVNKATHLAPLLLATYYNIYGPDLYYPLQSQGALGQGDKETFMAAAVALNATYYRVKTAAVSLGRNDGQHEKGTALVQHSPSDDLASRPWTHVGPIFLHSNTPKMNAGHLVDEGDLVHTDGVTRLRLLGSKEDQQRRFGLDIEHTIWDLLVQTGCELAGVIKEWKDRKDLCTRLEEHYRLVFGTTDL